MKTIRIFLASSEELDYDRNVFGNLVRRLDDIYEKRGIRIKLFEWEDYDAAYNDRRKQNEYNDKVRESDIFLALFYKKAGKFTIEEFGIASEEFKAKASPKIFTFFKDLKQPETETPELADFKKHLFDELGHYWCQYDNREGLQFQFLMQLQLVENSEISEIQVEDGAVTMDGLSILQMDKLQFVANNVEYVKLSGQLKSLPVEIEKARLRLEKYPNDADLMEDLQRKLDQFNKLKEEFGQYQQYLFNVAQRIAQMQCEYISDRMTRAIEAFLKGDARSADAILDEAQHDAAMSLAEIQKSKKIGLSSLEELILNAKTKMANDSIPIADRVEATMKIYEMADALAKEVDYDNEKYAKLLRGYAEFLRKRDPMKAVGLFVRQAELLENTHDHRNVCLAKVYDDIARIWKDLKGEENLDKAWFYLEKAIEIKVQQLGEKHPNVAHTYLLMGEVQIHRLRYDEGKAYIGKAIEICEETVGKWHKETALAYRAMGLLYKKLYEKDKDTSNYEQAKKYYSLAIEVLEFVEGEEKEETLYTDNNLANLYRSAGEYDKALELHKKSLDIKERVMGFFNFSTAVEYNNMGNVYHDKVNYDEALNCYSKALKIKEKILKEGDYSFSNTYKRMGVTYMAMGKYQDAEKYLSLALEIRENQLKKGDERITELLEALEQCKNEMRKQ